MDRFTAFSCWFFRGCLGLVAFIMVFALWYSTAHAQTPTQIPIQCNNDGECLILEKDLKRLIESNNAAALEVIKLRKFCRDA